MTMLRILERKGYVTHALAEREATLGREHLEVAYTLVNLALVSPADERASLLRRGLKILDRQLGEAHPQTLEARLAASMLLSDPDQARAMIAPGCAALARFAPGVLRQDGEIINTGLRSYLACERFSIGPAGATSKIHGHVAVAAHGEQARVWLLHGGVVELVDDAAGDDAPGRVVPGRAARRHPRQPGDAARRLAALGRAPAGGDWQQGRRSAALTRWLSRGCDRRRHQMPVSVATCCRRSFSLWPLPIQEV